MPKTPKAKEAVNESEVQYTSEPQIKVVSSDIALLGLNLDLGRQDLNDNFHAIQDKINEIIKKVC
jgi:hypothetical protein